MQLGLDQLQLGLDQLQLGLDQLQSVAIGSTIAVDCDWWMGDVTSWMHNMVTRLWTQDEQRYHLCGHKMNKDIISVDTR